MTALKSWHRSPDEYVDLICHDPPFNSNEKYNKIFKDSRLSIAPQIKAFDDMWLWDNDSAERVEQVKNALANPASKVIAAFELCIPQTPMLSYTSYMAQRLFEMHRILQPTGSIYLHCDPTASHYLKLVMDAVFGVENFRNEIIWHYGKWTNAANHFQRNHDILLFYSKSDNYLFNKQFQITIDKQKKLDKGYDTNRVKGVTQLLVYDKQKAKKKIEAGNYDKVVYLDDKDPGVVMHDTWHDINILNSQAQERLGYPTQKPLSLYERIIKASSKPGDLVLDPFAGCGTTIEAARKNNRRAIGIDILPFALRLINRHRIIPQGIAPMPVYGVPVDMRTAEQLAKTEPFKFQDWAISLIDGLASNAQKVGDDGIDGFGMLHNKPDNIDKQGIVVQVTGAGGSQRAKFDRLQTTIRNNNAAMGILITLNTQNARKNWKHTLDPIQMGETHYDPIQCFSIEEYYEQGERWEPLLKLPALANPWTGKEIQETLFDKIKNA